MTAKDPCFVNFPSIVYYGICFIPNVLRTNFDANNREKELLKLSNRSTAALCLLRENSSRENAPLTLESYLWGMGLQIRRLKISRRVRTYW